MPDLTLRPWLIEQEEEDANVRNIIRVVKFNLWTLLIFIRLEKASKQFDSFAQYPSRQSNYLPITNIHQRFKLFSFQINCCCCCWYIFTSSWLSMLESSRWLQHMAGLLRAAVAVAAAIEKEARPVLVHCSDGWDRTPQIVALAQILLDPFYRTIEVKIYLLVFLFSLLKKKKYNRFYYIKIRVFKFW